MSKLFLFIISFLGAAHVHAQCGQSPNVVTHTYGGHDYELIQETLSWENAATCAVSRGGYLAEIGSQEEHDSLFLWLSTDPSINPNGTIDVFGASSIWLGGTDKNTEGDWTWDGDDDAAGTSFWAGNWSGSVVNSAFTAWGVSPPEPDNSGGSQNYLTWRLSGNNTSLWNDLHAPASLYFLVEMNTGTATIDEQLETSDLISVYPVPSSNEITIEYTSSELITKVEIINVSGELIATHEFQNSSKVKIDLSKFSSGYYVLNVHLSNEQIVQKKITR
ncbi:MAG: T9SS type A sorting domain-containing protein [Crocinitomicaceae bacterium]|nr:T9SS type A sorting domain-containing protein [Crocinitomicaceae bacterium]